MLLLRLAAFCIAWAGVAAAQTAPEPAPQEPLPGATLAAPAWPEPTPEPQAEPVADPAAPPATPTSPAPATPEVGRIWTATDAPASEATSEQVASRAAQIQTDAPALMLNGVLTDRTGRTLYVFDADKRGASTCNGICLKLWPPYLAGVDDTPRNGFTITERLDGGLQWVHENRPLYYWVHDEKPGDVTGDGVNDVWHAVRE